VGQDVARRGMSRDNGERVQATQNLFGVSGGLVLRLAALEQFRQSRKWAKKMGIRGRPTKWPDDPELRRAYEWFVSQIGEETWRRRRTEVMRRVSSAFKNRKANSAPISIRDPVDTFGWYLFLCESLLDHPGDYDFAQGSRVIPLMKALGRHLDLLRQVGGIKARVQRLATSERRDPDSGIFEILVALCYLRNGWSSVRFVPESPTSKTYDLEVSEKNRSLAVECKRMAKSSQYSIEERENFQRMWQPLSNYLVRSGIEVSFDIMSGSIPLGASAPYAAARSSAKKLVTTIHVGRSDRFTPARSVDDLPQHRRSRGPRR